MILMRTITQIHTMVERKFTPAVGVAHSKEHLFVDMIVCEINLY
jgi:hypothetical protein